jgi:tetratricopeptide (TPR) repeat protein
VLEGTVAREGDRVRVTVQLLDARDDAHLWSERYDRKMGGMLALQSEVAAAVASEVRAELTEDERAGLQAQQVDPGAYDAYVRGLELYTRRGDMLDAVAAFERAVSLDPAFAEAHALLAASRMQVAGQFLRPDAQREGQMPAAVAAARRALELDERQGLAHSTIGVVRLFQWDFVGADRSLERAVQLSPSDPGVLGGYSWYLLMVGRQDEARRITERLRLVAPLDPTSATVVARNFFYLRDYARALEEFERARGLGESVDLLHLHLVYWKLGRLEEAHETQLELTRQLADLGLPGRREMAEAQERGWAEGGFAGGVRGMLEVMKELESRGLYSPYSAAMNSARLGETDETFRLLERSYETREAILYSLKANPMADSLRSDPRYDDLVRRIGFPES